MSCLVLDIELADKNVTKKLGVFIDLIVEGDSFCPPEKYKLTSQTVSYTKNLHGAAWNRGRLDYNELLNILPRDVNGENFANEAKN